MVYNPFDFVTPDCTPEPHGRREIFLVLSDILYFCLLFYVHFLFTFNALTCIFVGICPGMKFDDFIAGN